MGVPASRAATAAEFAQQLHRALAEPGPHLIEAIVPRSADHQPMITAGPGVGFASTHAARVISGSC